MLGFLQMGAATADLQPLLRQHKLSCEVYILHKFYKAFISNIYRIFYIASLCWVYADWVTYICCCYIRDIAALNERR